MSARATLGEMLLGIEDGANAPAAQWQLDAEELSTREPDVMRKRPEPAQPKPK